jgi:hypothetical protein
MKAIRTTISITPEVYAKAKDVMRARSFSKFSTLLHQLIREEWDRKCGSAPPSTPPAPPKLPNNPTLAPIIRGGPRPRKSRGPEDNRS